MRVVAAVLGGVVLWTLGWVGVAVADVVGPHPAGNYSRQQLATWERELVLQWLQDYGLSPDEAARQLASVRDEEIHELILQAENMGLPYGGGALELVIAVLVILILIIILLRLLNKEIIIA